MSVELMRSRARSAKDRVDQFFFLMPPLVQEAARWLALGAPAAAEPWDGFFELADRGPKDLVLTRTEVAGVECALGCALTGPVPLAKAGGDGVEAAVSRGMLVASGDHLALSPAALWSVGVAAWAPRTIVVAPAVGGRAVRHALVGRRAVSVVPDPEGYRFMIREPARVAEELLALLPPPGQAGPKLQLAMRWTHRAAPDEDAKPYAEQVALEPGVEGIGWVARRVDADVSWADLRTSVASARKIAKRAGAQGARWVTERVGASSADAPTETTVTHLTHAEAKAGLGSLVMRGEATDLELADEAETRSQAASRSTRPIEQSPLLELGFSELWPGPKVKRSDPHLSERGFHAGVSLYWRPQRPNRG